MKNTYAITILIAILIVPISVSYATQFTMFGNTFEEGSECAEFGLKYFEAISEKPYNLDQVQPQMMIGEKRCNPNAP